VGGAAAGGAATAALVLGGAAFGFAGSIAVEAGGVAAAAISGSASEETETKTAGRTDFREITLRSLAPNGARSVEPSRSP
jgi:hypothetical protein